MTSAAENEARVLSFRRERVGEGVQVAHVALRQGESSLFHHHTRTRDTFYVVSGELTISLYADEAALRRSAPALGEDRFRTVHTSQARSLTRVTLRYGDVFVVEPHVVHCAANLREIPCEFLCIEGVGEYDFVLEDSA